MVSVSVELRNVEGTEAAMGRAGGHTIVVDRPEDKAGGRGLGFNGAQLLAIGGCFCNDLRYVAHGMRMALGKTAVGVTVELEGDPPVTTGATMAVSCGTLDGSDANAIVERARIICMVSNSLRQGIPVTIETST